MKKAKLHADEHDGGPQEEPRCCLGIRPANKGRFYALELCMKQKKYAGKPIWFKEEEDGFIFFACEEKGVPSERKSGRSKCARSDSCRMILDYLITIQKKKKKKKLK